MILYLDTSSLVKLYVEEAGSGDVGELVSKSNAIATSMVAYAEARSAFARRFRENALSREGYSSLLSSFESDWDNYLQVKVSKALVRSAGDLAERHGLRGFDAIHLASALVLLENSGAPVLFSCFYDRLQRASIQAGLKQPGS
jgi:uncharacterized protein